MNPRIASSIEARVERFLQQPRIAVAGVSTRRPTGCNAAFARFREAGHTVWPIHPHLAEYEGVRSYPTLSACPEVPDALFSMASPSVTAALVDECIALGVRHVWMHCMLGTKPGLAPKITSVSEAAVAKCKANGIEVIPGSCPNQFLRPDVFHAVLRRGSSWLGLLRDPADRVAS